VGIETFAFAVLKAPNAFVPLKEIKRAPAAKPAPAQIKSRRFIPLDCIFFSIFSIVGLFQR
jgi:hypothetical protein